MSFRDKFQLLSGGSIPGRDWQALKDQYIREVNALHNKIRDWLKEYSSITFGYEPIIVSEEYIGEYNATTLDINIQGRIIALDPIGRNIIGASGRVDCYRRGFKSNSVMLILSDKEEWQIWWNRKQIDPLSKSSFEDLLDKLID